MLRDQRVQLVVRVRKVLQELRERPAKPAQMEQTEQLDLQVLMVQLENKDQLVLMEVWDRKGTRDLPGLRALQVPRVHRDQLGPKGPPVLLDHLVPKVLPED